MSKVKPFSLFSDFDLQLFAAGKHFKLFNKFGSHPMEVDGESGVYFAVYAPGARAVSVIGNFNFWKGGELPLYVQWNGTGIWEGFIPGVKSGEIYKYQILSHHDNRVREKADPYAKKTEQPPKTASVIWDRKYEWKDQNWIKNRAKNNNLDSPMSIYECHIGSWKKSQDGSRSLHYSELADQLVTYLLEMNYTHVQFMPVMEHPYYPSWGYLCTGYFAPTSRFGDPEDLKHLIDVLHQNGIGVFLDWVPAHFPDDDFALADFDGTRLYEHPDRGKGFHPDWNSLIFNFEREQIRSFLISSAHFWIEEFHADGLRVDAVASILYLDYSREEGQWQPNQYGGNEYLAAIDFLKDLNTSIYADFPDVQMIAEESTSFSGVTRPVHLGGLGFGLKWMMGWMNDTLKYMSEDPIHRKYHHNQISFSLTYAYSENYLLPLSHDEVVHGKNSIVYKMPGDEWQKFANVRLLYFYMYTHPGQKLLFMGNDIGQTEEWNVNKSLDWQLLQYESHKGINTLVRKLNSLYSNEPSLYEQNYKPEGFEWIDYSDNDNSVLAYKRKGKTTETIILCNFTPVVLNKYRIGVNDLGTYEVIFNTDEKEYWGSDIKIDKVVKSEEVISHHRPCSIEITLPPLAGIMLKKKSK